MLDILNEFVVLVILAVCLSVGYIIKESLDFIPNKRIPLIVGVLGICLSILHFRGVSVEIIAKGLASGLASTGAYELKRNLTQKE